MTPKRKTRSKSAAPGLVNAGHIDRRVMLIRGQKVLLDADLAELYGVETRALNQAVQRNLDRFPADFMFQLTQREMDAFLRSQTVTSNGGNRDESETAGVLPRSQIVMSKRERTAGGRRYLPYAFTEQGVAMLSSVLRSKRAVAVNIEIMRAFVRLRQMIASHADLARKLATLEKKYDQQFKAVFEAIRELMAPPEEDVPEKEMGFHTVLAKPASPKS